MSPGNGTKAAQQAERWDQGRDFDCHVHLVHAHGSPPDRRAELDTATRLRQTSTPASPPPATWATCRRASVHAVAWTGSWGPRLHPAVFGRL